MITSNRIRGSAERLPAKCGIITISYSAVEALLNLPPRWRIVAAKDDFNNNAVVFKVESDDFKEVNEGVEVGDIVVGTGGWSSNIIT